MKTWFKPILMASLIALGSSAAIAQPGPGRGQGTGLGSTARPQAERINPAAVRDRVELRFARMEVALGIQPDQRAAWDEFKAAALQRAEENSQRFQQMWERGAAPTTMPERLALMEENQKARQGDFAQMRKSVETFYAKLSPAQQKIFDADFGPGWQGGGYGPRGGAMGNGSKWHRGGGRGPGNGFGPCGGFGPGNGFGPCGGFGPGAGPCR